MTVEINFNLTLGTWLRVALHFVGSHKKGVGELESTVSHTSCSPP